MARYVVKYPGKAAVAIAKMKALIDACEQMIDYAESTTWAPGEVPAEQFEEFARVCQQIPALTARFNAIGDIQDAMRSSAGLN
jgi:hypothetical protein